MTSLTDLAAAPAADRLSWTAVAAALRGNALAAFPREAFDEEIVICSFLGRRHVLLQCPEAIRHVLVENPQNYARIPAVRRVLRPMFGGGLFLSTGEEWRRQRREVAPAFAPRAVQMLAREVVVRTGALAAELAAPHGGFGGEPVDLVPRLQRLALDIIGGAVFSLDMARHAPEMRELILRYAVRLGRASLADFLLPEWVMTPADIARARFRQRWRRMIGRIIDERSRRQADAGACDLFDVLAAPNPETGALPDAERLGDQVATIVVAGHETTAAGLFWTLYLLAQHPGVQARLAAEVERLPPTPDSAADILPQLTYTRAVVDEALRLYPPAFVIVRQATADDIVAGLTVPRGALILIAPWILHRHRAFWAAAERFDPARFLPGAPAPRRFAYMPFGAGPRICVGAPFALTELVLAIATLAHAFEIGLAPHRPVNPVGRVTLQPATPAPFLLRPRRRRA